MELIFGAGKLDRRIAEVESLLGDWREKERDFGQLYLEHEPSTPRDRVLVEDLAVTMLVNSRVEARQAMGVFRNGPTLDLSVLPDKVLGETTDGERQIVAEVVAAILLPQLLRGRERDGRSRRTSSSHPRGQCSTSRAGAPRRRPL